MSSSLILSHINCLKLSKSNFCIKNASFPAKSCLDLVTLGIQTGTGMLELTGWSLPRCCGQQIPAHSPPSCNLTTSLSGRAAPLSGRGALAWSWMEVAIWPQPVAWSCNVMMEKSRQAFCRDLFASASFLKCMVNNDSRISTWENTDKSSSKWTEIFFNFHNRLSWVCFSFLLPLPLLMSLKDARIEIVWETTKNIGLGQELQAHGRAGSRLQWVERKEEIIQIGRPQRFTF